MSGTCATCGGATRPLLTGEYCPNDCDRRQGPQLDGWGGLLVYHTEQGAFPGRRGMRDGRMLTAYDRSGLRKTGEGTTACPFCGATADTVERNGETSIMSCRPACHRFRVYEDDDERGR